MKSPPRGPARARFCYHLGQSNSAFFRLVAAKQEINNIIILQHCHGVLDGHIKERNARSVIAAPLKKILKKDPGIVNIMENPDNVDDNLENSNS